MSTHLCCLSCIPPLLYWRRKPNRELVQDEHIPQLVSEMLSEIDTSNFEVHDLGVIIHTALKKLNNIEEVYGLDQFFWEYYRTGFAIGFFGEERGILKDARISGGKGALLQHVNNYDPEHIGSWEVIIEGGQEQRTYTGTHPKYHHPNFFILEGPYRYLEAWIDRSLVPPRYEIFPYDQGEEMEFYEELWDIINALEGNSERSYTDGRLGFMSYGPPGKIFRHNMEVNYYCESRISGSPNLVKDIKHGLRGQDLMYAIMLDFNCWSTIRPDTWPSPPKDSSNIQSSLCVFPFSSAPRTMHSFWSNVPLAILELICSLLSFSSLQHLAGSCWVLHHKLGQPGFLDRAWRGHVPKWILPVPSLPGELERSHQIAKTWLWHESDLASNNPFSAEHFPWLQFMKACRHSMSMMNRHRIWVQVKQLEKMWKLYRNEGGIGWRKQKTLEEIKALYKIHQKSLHSRADRNALDHFA